MSRRATTIKLFALWVLALGAQLGCQGGAIRPAMDVATGGNPNGTAAGSTGAGQGGSGTPGQPLVPVGEACGFSQQGHRVQLSNDVVICQPPQICTSETCPPPLGSCQMGQCVAKPGYKGLATLPQAWTTYYCQLSTGGCDGVTQVEKPAVTAQKVASQLGLSLCEGAAAGSAGCVGIAASSPLLVGNSQLAKDAQTQAQVTQWGLGLSEASNVCYHLTGPGGEAFVALTDRCGGYCKCQGSAYAECGACVNAVDMTPNCPCVGTAPGVSDSCCGAGCPTVNGACDWCASNNHPHFDVDQATFNHLCGAQAVQGSCQITKVEPFACPLGVTWPPP